MATRAETSAVYAAAAVQGIVLVTFPAASTIFTDPDQYGLSNTQYGVLFLPQVATAITASLLGASIGRRFGTKRVYLAGLACGLVSMLLLLFSASDRVEHLGGVSAPPRCDRLPRSRLRSRGPGAQRLSPPPSIQPPSSPPSLC